MRGEAGAPGEAVAREVAVITRVGVRRLLLGGEGVEQGESGLATNVLVVPRKQ